jgi:hypothetical protein
MYHSLINNLVKAVSVQPSAFSYSRKGRLGTPVERRRIQLKIS